MKMDLKGLAEERGKLLKVVANLPYYITVPAGGGSPSFDAE